MSWPPYLGKDSLPEWHNQPLFLMTDELAEPKKIVIDFFSAWNLAGFRAHIMALRDTALYCKNEKAMMKASEIVYTCEERLNS